MRRILKIKWENIFVIVLLATTIFGWVAFVRMSDVYTLALAIIPTIITLITILEYNIIKDCRKQVLDMWK